MFLLVLLVPIGILAAIVTALAGHLMAAMVIASLALLLWVCVFVAARQTEAGRVYHFTQDDCPYGGQLPVQGRRGRGYHYWGVDSPTGEPRMSVACGACGFALLEGLEVDPTAPGIRHPKGLPG